MTPSEEQGHEHRQTPRPRRRDRLPRRPGTSDAEKSGGGREIAPTARQAPPKAPEATPPIEGSIVRSAPGIVPGEVGNRKADQQKRKVTDAGGGSGKGGIPDGETFASSPSVPEDRCFWLDDAAHEGWKPKTVGPPDCALPPSEQKITAAEVLTLAFAFVVGALAAGLLLEALALLLGPASWPVQSLVGEGLAGHGLPVVLVCGALASLCAWRATGRRRRALARHLRGKKG